MQIKDFIKAYTDNKISHHKQFDNVEYIGHLNDYDELYNICVKQIDECIRFGSVNGYSKQIKDTLEDLSNVLVKMCNEKNNHKYNNYKKQIHDLEQGVQKYMKENNKNSVNTATIVMEWVEVYVQACETIKTLGIGVERFPILDEAINKFKTIGNIVSECVDVASSDALEYAKEIIDLMKQTSAPISTNMYTKQTLAIIDKAIEVAKKWHEDKVGVAKHEKPIDTSAINIKNAGDMYLIAASSEIQENIQMFSSNLKEYRDRMNSERFNNDAQAEEAAKLKKQIDDLKNEQEQLFIKYQNGEISEDDCAEKCQDIDEDIQDFEQDIKILEKEIKQNEVSFRNYNRSIKSLERINRNILKFKNDPIMISYIGQSLDFNILSRVLRGTGSDADYNWVINFNYTNKRLEEILGERHKEFYNKLNEVEFNDIPEQRETEQQTQERKNKNAEYMAKRFGKKQTEETEEHEQNGPQRLNDIEA